MELVDEAAVLATEKYGSQETWKYRLKGDVIKRERQADGSSRTGGSITGAFKSIFLPQGYPESVSDDYVEYQIWDTLQAFSSSMSGTLATQASLKGVGVGNQAATVAAATVTWLLRDGTGMLGRILFAWLKGNKLDSEAKKWRLFADILNDFAMFIEILAPYYPPMFTLIACIAGVFKSIVGVAGGATRAALTVHQARRNNMADISAKDGSQETLVNLAGLLVSLVLIPLVTDNPRLTFALFFLFTALHLFANYKAVRSVVMETLNEARLSIVLEQYLSDGRVLSPREANPKEPVFLEWRREVPIKLGVSLRELVTSPQDLQLALKHHHKPFLIGIQQGCVSVCLSSEASVANEIEATCQALCLAAVMKASPPPPQQMRQLALAKGQDPWVLVSESYKFMDQMFPAFLLDLEKAKWLTDRTLLDWNEWRVDWRKKMS